MLSANYYATPCEITIYFKVINYSHMSAAPPNAFVFDNNNILSGVTNFSISMSLNNAVLRGIGDCVQIRKPVGWDFNINITRYIVRNAGGLNGSIFDLVHKTGTVSKKYLFPAEMTGNFTCSFRVDVSNRVNNKLTRFQGYGAIKSVSISAEKTRVEEVITIVPYDLSGVGSVLV